jgi:multidrug efflux pump subunit AcrA (membrane-fusion protein)
VSQGVVSYTVKIAFDTQDSQIKPGMTVNAAIITDAKTDVLSVPSSAVKTQNGVQYVLVFDPALSESTDGSAVISPTEPARVTVQTGITDDTSVEILSGLTDGQQIVVRTTTGTAAAGNTTPTNSSRGGFSGPQGGAIRI